ncbi:MULTISPECIES: AAA family ATPase [unclassified Oceanispirochaeta]|uniref:AAA family ATPase n=1 Tax=unclassified Oceanispirochaeta TaxID=2635722 RepID=UPI000E092BD8|nr:MULTISPECIES: AAA family ATPase [unclassified Oceanispirochaeta]MBF9018354.1 AAA family ATPase [Oceanispirochaeta sp. M2]NPD74841.1 AAA family ATPase [Oceanispirochaeta sp. M1]RDG29334.1 anticodon nuclease [Oceanispirochaeta sp. M1]
MSKALTEIAQQLKDSNKKVQLIYAFNGTGKTRLSGELKQLISPKNEGYYEGDDDQGKVIYYNAFTEDLFYWDNDLNSDTERKLKIQPNNFTKWVLEEQGQEPNIIENFQHYTNQFLMPKFSEDFSEVSFSIERGDDENLEHIKISKGEESNFIWCVFYSLLEQIVEVLNIVEPTERETNRFDHLEYVFIDDPVSSLDENRLIELAVHVAQLIKSSDFTNGQGLRFIISTHNPLFYNVLYNELSLKSGYILNRNEDDTFELLEKRGDSNHSFSYHLYLKQLIKQAIAENSIQKYHFTLLRNLYEKTASFLGYPRWSELLPGDKKVYLNRIIQFTSHSTLSNEAVAEPTPQEKQTVNFLLEHLMNNYGYWQEGVQND